MVVIDHVNLNKAQVHYGNEYERHYIMNQSKKCVYLISVLKNKYTQQEGVYKSGNDARNNHCVCFNLQAYVSVAILYVGH